MTIEKMTFELFRERMIELINEANFKVGDRGQGNDMFIQGAYKKFYEPYYKKLKDMDESDNEELYELYKTLRESMSGLVEKGERIASATLSTTRSVKFKSLDSAAEVFVLKIFAQKVKSLLVQRGLRNL